MYKSKNKSIKFENVLFSCITVLATSMLLESIIPRIIPLISFLLFLSWITYLYYTYNLKKSSKIIYYDMSKIDFMNDYDFEEFICDTYKKKGYKTAYTTAKSGDFGADVIVPDKIQTIAIQAKKYAPDNATGIDSVQEVIGALHHYHATKGIVITTSYFTKSAKILAAESNIELIDREKLVLLLNTPGK